MAERQFGPYRLVHQIAVGGMAEIYLAKTRGIAGFEKYVALKMIHPNFSQDEQFVEMLIDEAKISVQLQHANIAQTFDLGRVDQTYYITMEYVDGADLYKILRRAAERGMPMPVDVAAFIAKEMANGLDYAHRRRDLAGQALGIVHRDVSPQNVLISHAGEVKLVDFGIAKATMKARQTAVGVIKGKYYYMSPEQAWGDRVDHRTDIFSTGVCLYEALTGRMLYQEEELQRLLQQVRRAEIASPTTRRRDIPPQLERIVMRSLARERDERYQNAGDMATDLERFLHVYSPVFTASKLADFFRGVLAEEEPPTTKRPAVPKRSAPEVPMHTMRLEPDQILSDSAELSDENSIIFDLRSSGNDQGGGPSLAPTHTISTSAHTLSGVAMHDAQSAEDLDNIEEQTMVSGPPGFGGGGGNLGNFEPTLVGTGFDGSSTNFDEGETEGGGDIADIHAEPTLLQSDNADLQRRLREANNMPARPASPPPRPQQPARQGAGGKRAPANPVLAASTPKPAVSLTGPKRSRKTPAEGTPAEPSLLAALVPKDGVEPVRREAAPQAEATLPARPGAPGLAQTQQAPVAGQPPALSLAQTQQAPVAGQPPTFSLAQTQQAPVAGQPGMPMQPGAWPGAYPGMPGNGGYSPAGFAQQQYSPLPMGQAPTSFTKQLQQLELEEIPDAYKVGSKTPRWLMAAVLVVACVATGVGLGIMLLGGDGEKKEAALIIESMPSGALVTVNGIRLVEPTPTRYVVEPGKRYEIVFELAGYQTKTHPVVVPQEEPRAYRVPVSLQRVRTSASIITQPPNAEIYLNGVLQGRTPRTLEKLDPDVDYTLELRLKGYDRHVQKLTWPEDKTEISIDIPLSR